MNPFVQAGRVDENSNANKVKYDNATFEIKNMSHLMHQNLIFDTTDKKWYDTFNRFGWLNVLDNDQICREYVFFTKPDLYIMDGNSYQTAKLNSTMENIPFFRDAFNRHKLALSELQYSISARNGGKDPFMHFLSNCVASRMDIPALTSDSNKSTPNIYGVSIDYRSHSFKSDYSFDFAISFKDTAQLDIYTMVKAYDTYMRMLKAGEIDFGITSSKNIGIPKTTMQERFKNYIKNHIIPEQFSVYKFVVGSDGETLLYWAKATGVYFTDVPRADFSDPPNDGFKYSISFHANFAGDDMDPVVLAEFNTISIASTNYEHFLPVYDNLGVNNETGKYARIISVKGDRRAMRHGADKNYSEYRLKWTNWRKNQSYAPNQTNA